MDAGEHQGLPRDDELLRRLGDAGRLRLAVSVTIAGNDVSPKGIAAKERKARKEKNGSPYPLRPLRSFAADKSFPLHDGESNLGITKGSN